MDDEQPLDRAERRRRARAEQKAKRRANHPGHGPDPAAVMIQLLNEARRFEIGELISLSDVDLDVLPAGSVEFARSVFAPDFSVDRRLHQLAQLVAAVCGSFADVHPDGDEAEQSMLERCGLVQTMGDGVTRVELTDTTLFSSTSMLVANRVALIEKTPPSYC